MTTEQDASAVFLCCRECRAPVTLPIVELTDRSQISGADGQPILPRGFFVFHEGNEYAGEVAVHLEDVVALEYFPDGRGLTGCCGPMGDAINRMCREGHGVAAECSECWLPHGMHFSLDRVKMRPSALQPLPSRWKNKTLLDLAQTISEERAFDRLPILADALEESGCDNADILTHCRQPGDHVRGCWVVDLVLGRE
jgi:hypothetical protein